MAVRIGEISAVSTPKDILWRLDDTHLFLIQAGKNIIYLLFTPRIMGESNPTEALSPGRNSGVVSQRFPTIEPQEDAIEFKE